MRTSKTVSGKKTTFTLVGGSVWGDGTNYYVWGAELITNGSVYYVYNAHGDVIQLLNANGTVTKTYDYDAYGNELTRDLNDSNPFRYCGEYYDTETGFIYLRARYYSPDIGRFISVDPAHDGLNWYVYCENNPVNYFDSSGMSAEKSLDWSKATLKEMWKDTWEYLKEKLRKDKPSKSTEKPLDWSKATLEEMRADTFNYIMEASKIGDGEYALIDNYRNQIDGIFHEQWLYGKYRRHELGRELEIAITKAGWNFDNWSFIPLNFGDVNAMAYADYDSLADFDFGVGASCTAWMVEISIVIKDYRYTLSFGVGKGWESNVIIKNGVLENLSFGLPAKSPRSITFYLERVS